jgi:hypothetical protein
MTKCLIDADILSYECGAAGQYKNEEGQVIYRPFDFVAEVVDNRIRTIQEECWATEPSTLFFSSDPTLIRMWNKLHKDSLQYEENFRVGVAKTKPYKGTRVSEKPFHFHNLRAYLLSAYHCALANGEEADDLICRTMAANPDYIACSRDKDLRQVPGRHYSWEIEGQAAWGPKVVTELGELYWEGKKLRGNGTKFFFAQMILGDTTDNIPGLPKGGPVLAYKTLADLVEEHDCYLATKELYEQKGLSEEYFKEQWNLLWIRR